MRTPPFQPLPCYGLEYEKGDVKCQQCPHQQSCRQYITNPDGIPLSQVKFDLLPAASRIQRSVKSRATVAGIYAQCYRRVYGLHSTPDKPHPDVCRIIEAKAAARSCSVDLFCLIAMVARKMSAEPFHARMLTGNFCEQTFDLYYDAFVKLDNRVDLETIEKITGVLVHERDFTRRFAAAETALGHNVIAFVEKGDANWKMNYDACARGVDPLWRALNEKNPELLGRDAKEFRVMFKKKPSLAAQAFLAWQASMPVAVRQVFSERGMNCDDFLCATPSFTSTRRFWQCCGYVFQQFSVRAYMRSVLP